MGREGGGLKKCHFVSDLLNDIQGKTKKTRKKPWFDGLFNKATSLTLKVTSTKKR